MEQLVDRDELGEFLRTDAALHIYAIGDLDPFFWPHVRTWGRRMDSELRAVAMLYIGAEPPCLMAMERKDPEALRKLLASLGPELPSPCYAHFSPGVVDVLEQFKVVSHGRHLKMELRERGAIDDVDTSDVVRFSPEDEGRLRGLYDAHYPGNWFDPRMLETGQYFGICEGDAIVCVAGVHVYSREQRVAALGNIATATTHRRQGFARRATACLCKSLLQTVDVVGLNVHADNTGAIRCYEQLGFEVVAEYEEFMLTRRGA